MKNYETLRNEKGDPAYYKDRPRGRPRRFELIDEMESIPDPAQDFDKPEPNHWREDRLRALRIILRTEEIKKIISPRQSEVLNMRMGGMKVKEIAELLGLSSFTVKEHLRETKAKLKHAVEALV